MRAPPSESEQTRPHRLLQQIRQQIVATLFSITAEKKEPRATRELARHVPEISYNDVVTRST